MVSRTSWLALALTATRGCSHTSGRTATSTVQVSVLAQSNHSNWRLRFPPCSESQVIRILSAHSSSSSGKRLHILARLSPGIESLNLLNSCQDPRPPDSARGRGIALSGFLALGALPARINNNGCNPRLCSAQTKCTRSPYGCCPMWSISGARTISSQAPAHSS
jgi:hypothetical protein